MPTQTIDKLLLDLHVLTGIPVRLYDEKQRGLLSYSEHQPLCLFTHSSECKSDAARLIAHCYAFDDACFEGAKRTGDVFVQYCPLGFYSATCPIYDSERLLGFLQFSDILCDSEAARQNTRALALSYLPSYEKRIEERLSLAHCCAEERLETIPSLLRAVCGYIASHDLFPTKGITLSAISKQYIRLHQQQSITLGDIADHLHCSRSTLTKTFKRECGISVMQYVNELRLERACRQLANTELSIGAICDGCGFSGLEYFSAQFKKAYGISPTSYRKKSKESKKAP